MNFDKPYEEMNQAERQALCDTFATHQREHVEFYDIPKAGEIPIDTRVTFQLGKRGLKRMEGIIKGYHQTPTGPWPLWYWIEVVGDATYKVHPDFIDVIL